MNFKESVWNAEGIDLAPIYKTVPNIRRHVEKERVGWDYKEDEQSKAGAWEESVEE